MAIVEMKRISILALQADRRKLLHAMQKMGCVEVSPPPTEEMAEWTVSAVQRKREIDGLMPRLEWLIANSGRYNPIKQPMFGYKPDADPADVQRIRRDEPELIRTYLERAEALERETGDHKGRLARLQALEEQLLPWAGLDIPVEQLKGGTGFFQQAGTLPTGAVSQLAEAWSGRPAYLQVISEERGQSCLWMAVHPSVKDELLSDLKAAGWMPMNFGEATGTVQEQLNRLGEERKTIAEAQQRVESDWKDIAQNLKLFQTWHDLLDIEREELSAADNTLGTKTAFMLRGWVPAAAADAVTKRLTELSPTCSVEITAPEPGDDPPVQLHNGKYTAPFASIVEGFALPSPYGVDPTRVMAPFYALLFGMMLSDAGYGIVMAIAIPLIFKLMHPGKSSSKMLMVLFFGAIATAVAGAIYNTWFGFSLGFYKLLDPIGDPMPVMMLCMGLGVIHLFAGLCVGIYMNVKRGKPLDALYDQVSWMLLVTGLIMLVVGGTVGKIGQYMAIAGVVLILLFAGREKKNPIKRLFSGLGALYGATSWISDILSYMRLFGMGLATGVIGMVINMLVGMVFNAGFIGMIIGSVLFVAAHAFNLGINALGAYVHACRLQYIEFFGKFYEEGGIAFRPMTGQTRYYTIRDSE